MRSATMPTVPRPIDSTTTLPRSSRCAIASAIPAARATTPAAAGGRAASPRPARPFRRAATSEMCSGSGMISRTRSSGSAYSCCPRSKLTSDTCRCGSDCGRAGTGGRNRAPGRSARPGSAELREFVAQQPLRIQNLDRAVAFGALDHAVEKIGIDGACSGVVRLDPVRRKRQKIVDPVDHKSDGSAAIDHDDACRLVRRRVRKAKQAPQADHRQHHAAQVGKTQQASRSERHVGETRQPDDLADVVEPESEGAVRDLEHDNMLVSCSLGRYEAPRSAPVVQAVAGLR